MNKAKKPMSTHLRHDGTPRIVDVSGKPISRRIATATGRLRLGPQALQTIEEGTGPKGSVIAVATIAAINAAKHTSSLVPLCHNLQLEKVEVDFVLDPEAGEIECKATVSAEARTGVEMESLMAVHIGLLTVYDLCKSVDRNMEVTSIRLVEKIGGSSHKV